MWLVERVGQSHIGNRAEQNKCIPHVVSKHYGVPRLDTLVQYVDHNLIQFPVRTQLTETRDVHSM